MKAQILCRSAHVIVLIVCIIPNVSYYDPDFLILRPILLLTALFSGLFSVDKILTRKKNIKWLFYNY